jgi:hypothetical protein
MHFGRRPSKIPEVEEDEEHSAGTHQSKRKLNQLDSVHVPAVYRGLTLGEQIEMTRSAQIASVQGEKGQKGKHSPIFYLVYKTVR